jgi:ABC-type uncharacterized transport system YnjBCD substrate-binding protein
MVPQPISALLLFIRASPRTCGHFRPAPGSR